MSKIDFEKIRVNAMQKISANIKDDPYGALLKSFAEMSSQVTKAMLIEYDQQLTQDD